MTSDQVVLHEFNPKNMPFRRLGTSGLRVPLFSLGGWLTLGASLHGGLVKEIIKTAFDAGINMFDTAEAYAAGQSEVEMGRAMKELGLRRTDLVITTKLFWGIRTGPNDGGLSRKHIIEGTKESLRRLGMDYVDVIFAHRPDNTVPMEEIVRAFNYVIDKGWAFYWATSEWSALEIEEAYHVAEKLNLIPPIAEQCKHNMFHRERPEKEYEPLYKKYGLGTTTFSSLAAGLLTGKYNDGIPEGSRFATVEMFQRVASRLQQEEGKEEIRKVRELTKIAAEEPQTSPAALALAWVAKNPNTSTVILGASSAEQLKENLKALEVLPRLTPEIMEKIEAILNNKPSPPVNYGRPPLDPLGRSSVFRTGQY
ncbi:putative voltage-gated potassium channel subunit beta [Termitomyces sp. T112]|nr:putative voltage-gated potassium channel subunit beta [Termitomyces sp. T112]